MLELRWAARTDVGKVRAANEDSYLSNGTLFAVADGLGGHTAGEVASRLAVTKLAEVYVEHNIDALISAVRAANQAILDRVSEDSSLHGMGTTVTLLGTVEHEGASYLGLINVGDSRCYRLRDGLLEQLTDDHSLVNELVRARHITEEEAAVHPQRSVITRALGLEPTIPIDSWLVEPAVGDRFLLCSDGLTNEVPPEVIASIMRRIDDPEELVTDLVAEANAARGADNITAVVLDVLALSTSDDTPEPTSDGEPVALVGATGDAEPSDEASSPVATDATPTSMQADDGELVASDPTTPAGVATHSVGSETNAEPTPSAEAGGEKTSGHRTSRWRVGVFALAAIALIAGVLWIGSSYANNLTLSANPETHRIELVRGPREDLPGLSQEVIKVYAVDVRDLTENFQRQLDRGQHVSNEAAADKWVNAAFEESRGERPTTTSTTTTTTTTSVIPSFPSPLAPTPNPFGVTTLSIQIAPVVPPTAPAPANAGSTSLPST